MAWFPSSVCLSVGLFVYIINSLYPIDFEKNQTIRKGKEAILSKKIAFLFYAIQSAFVVRFSLNLHSLSNFWQLEPYLFLKKLENKWGKSNYFKLKICVSCLHNTVHICGEVFVKLS